MATELYRTTSFVTLQPAPGWTPASGSPPPGSVHQFSASVPSGTQLRFNVVAYATVSGPGGVPATVAQTPGPHYAGVGPSGFGGQNGFLVNTGTVAATFGLVVEAI